MRSNSEAAYAGPEGGGAQRIDEGGLFMRKGFSVLLALALSLFVALPAFTEDKVELQFVLWGTNEGLTSVFDLVDQYNASQDGIHVTVNGVDPSVYFQKLNAFFSSGTAPDIIQVAADYGNEYTAKGVFAPLDAYLTDELKGEWAQSLLDALKTDGVQYAIPIGVQVSFIAYNKALFDEAGLPYPTKDWTEAEFLDTVKKLTLPEKNQYGILVSGSANETIWNMYGDYCYDWDTNKMTAADNPSFKHAVELFYNLFVTDKATPAATSTKDIGGGFETGKYPMAIIHYWDIASLSSTIGESFDWDIVQFPVNEEYGVRWRSPLYVQAMSIANTSEHKDEAFEFIRWWATNAAPQTSMADSFPASTAIQNSAEYMASFPDGHPYDKQVVIDTIAEQGSAWWNCGIIAEINDNVIKPAIEKLLLQTDAVGVEETIETIQTKGQQLFDMDF